MKNNNLVLILFVLFLTVFGCSACGRLPYSLKEGFYGFEKAIITHQFTNEMYELDLDAIFTDNDAFNKWSTLTGFQISINKNTEFFRKKENRYFVVQEGLAYEVIEDNVLCLHFPNWRGYDRQSYDVKIILHLQERYA